MDLKQTDINLERRLELQRYLESILGSKNVYFQPPSNIQMQYPAIVYAYSTNRSRFANNNPYSVKRGYDVTVIDRDPDSAIPTKFESIPFCSFGRRYIANSLNHTVYTLFY